MEMIWVAVGLSAAALVVLIGMAFMLAGMKAELRRSRLDAGEDARGLRQEVSTNQKSAADTLGTNLLSNLTQMSGQITALIESNEKALDRVRSTLDNKIAEFSGSNERKLDEMRRDVTIGLTQSRDSLSSSLDKLGKDHSEQFDRHQQASHALLDTIRSSVETRVKELQDGNEKKLEEMRKTVDEKLHETLEKRLGESFKLVSERLEKVHHGLGEMKTLANGVGDLQRVLTNVKARGTWAEVQLGALLEQILTPDQYEKNVRVNKDSREHVEYAVKLPGRKGDFADVWLPIDSKFPTEDYTRLQLAADGGDPEAVREAVSNLARAIRGAAKDIRDKYILPPATTDYAVMFLATEGLYSEVLRVPGLQEELQTKYRVMPAGPLNLAALLNIIRVGFQTMAIEEHTADVMAVLGAAKAEFRKFGDVLAKIRNQLKLAQNSIDDTEIRSRAIERKLRSVEALPDAEAARILALASPSTNAADFLDEEEQPRDLIEQTESPTR